LKNSEFYIEILKNDIKILRKIFARHNKKLIIKVGGFDAFQSEEEYINI